jgi:hypothetical protein
MGARKRRTVGSRAASGGREFTLVLEDMRSQFKVFGEALQGVDAKLSSLETRVTSGFEQVDCRFEQVDRRFERVEGSIELLKAAVLDNSREIRGLQEAVARKVDRDEVVAVVGQALTRG